MIIYKSSGHVEVVDEQVGGAKVTIRKPSNFQEGKAITEKAFAKLKKDADDEIEAEISGKKFRPSKRSLPSHEVEQILAEWTVV